MLSFNAQLNNIVALLQSQQQQMAAMAQSLDSVRVENRCMKELLDQQKEDTRALQQSMSTMNQSIRKMNQDNRKMKQEFEGQRSEMDGLREIFSSWERKRENTYKRISNINSLMVQQFYLPQVAFQLFSKFPTELRLKTWKSDAFSRTVELNAYRDEAVWVEKKPFPVLFHICRESRKFAFKLYTKLSLTNDYPSCNVSVLFRPAIDIIYFDALTFNFAGACCEDIAVSKIQHLAMSLNGFDIVTVDDLPRYLAFETLTYLEEIIWVIPEHYIDSSDVWSADGQEPGSHKLIECSMALWKANRPIYRVMTSTDFENPNRKPDFGVWTPGKHSDCPYCKLHDGRHRARQELEDEDLGKSIGNELVDLGVTGDGGLEKHLIEQV